MNSIFGIKQPISSAPRDGTHILIFFGQDGVSQARYIVGAQKPWQFIDTNDGITWLINHAVDGPGGPSHWMPMPQVTREPESTTPLLDLAYVEAKRNERNSQREHRIQQHIRQVLDSRTSSKTDPEGSPD